LPSTRTDPLSSRTVCGNAPVEKAPSPELGVGMYWSSCWAGDDHARIGTVAFGSTQLAALVQPGR
jgi:hypothetical protein